MTDFGGPAQSWSLVAFCSVVTLTLLLCVITGPDREDLDEFYTGYRFLSPLRNGLAIAGDYISAATVLTVGGIIALCGYDGVVLALVQLPVTWLAVVFYELTARRFVDPLARRVRRAGREGRSLP